VKGERKLLRFEGDPDIRMEVNGPVVTHDIKPFDPGVNVRKLPEEVHPGRDRDGGALMEDDPPITRIERSHDPRLGIGLITPVCQGLMRSLLFIRLREGGLTVVTDFIKEHQSGLSFRDGDFLITRSDPKSFVVIVGIGTIKEVPASFKRDAQSSQKSAQTGVRGNRQPGASVPKVSQPPSSALDPLKGGNAPNEVKQPILGFFGIRAFRESGPGCARNPDESPTRRSLRSDTDDTTPTRCRLSGV
jgi:hypothetical protein